MYKKIGFLVIGIFYFLMNSFLFSQTFEAEGNIDPEHRAPSEKRGEVVVTFDLLPTKMSFNLPSFPCLVTENNISYYNGWTETYDSEIGGGSFEPLMDFNNLYSRMWIESQNKARIVVRWCGALCNPDGIIAHTDVPSGSPYGDGDWMDEWYIIYPDGVHVRKSRIYTYYAPVSRPFGWNREPPNYVHEFQEMLFLGDEEDAGHVPEDDINIEALTLIKMNGDFTSISYDSYPIHSEPTEEELYAAFGEFSNANIFVVNTKSVYHPFTIGREAGVSVSPYAPESWPLPRIFQSWPDYPDPDSGYEGAALGHMINREHYKKTKNTLTQIYLSGWTNSSQPDTMLVPLGKSWLYAPAIDVLSGCESIGYDQSQRAYVIVAKDEMMTFTLNGSSESPIYNPCFLIKNWNTDTAPEISINGHSQTWGTNNRYGLELNEFEVHEAVIWIMKKANSPFTLTVFGANPDTNAPNPNPLIWEIEPFILDEDSLAVSMTVIEASDPNGVEYYFECLDDSTFSSQWQRSFTYSVSDLAPNTEYRFHAKARDGGFNETEWSQIRSITSGNVQPKYSDFIGAGHANGIVASASSTDENAIAQNTVNGSGLLDETHSTDWIDTWTSDGGAGNPPAPSPNSVHGSGQWIHYDLGFPYQLGLMHVWNGNEIPARGLNSVTIDYSENDTMWTELGTFNFPQASGLNSYTGFDGPDFSGVKARYVLLTIHSNYGDAFGYALSEIRINLSDPTGYIEPHTNIPRKMKLYQNYPNPFNLRTQIQFDLPKSTYVTIDVYNYLGEKVMTLLDENMVAGYHRITFDGSNIPSGLYFYRIKARDFMQTKKCMLIK